ncbi:hypothetical protein SAMN04515691_0184 [Leifsonia sp. 98AMF]|uniref:hypothetical protein n=1 Tax=unclassified Leifsonia TaxID=2663824 RepID=UPI00087D6087|nr:MULTISPECIES: hypothetical protein [unclassified Leifsonia]SDH71953.1 hypothetical protein SAMN04515690_3836 [Leifsonia sp. 197AMF]SDJ50018.1 hypothetical protein SAMN04515684_3967 [Leifsonia sp. 466MF]SDK24494.1 hypothetical protein SAMN04515683_2798 [Leifsonia sp. 157MF]SDN69915.1 hypothetical protein SAMN04515686_2154 [Leifsonia sp. 509MF]SEN38301.1 hypothetical protein SAMN04515685_2782 [Leifsonia sp. 467MF]
METIRGVPLDSVPAWAVLERRLFAGIEDGWRLFQRRYTREDGGIRFPAVFTDRDGVDDLYEPFFNWPAFYLLGGSDDVLSAAKRHWEGVTAQLEAAGMLTDEYENGYDWFHQGESLLFFYGLCAADPGDAAFARRARRFAELYTDPAAGNYDPERNIIRAPHTGALGARPGLNDVVQPYSASFGEMRRYGLPLEDVPGIETWDDLVDPAKARAMGEAMQRAARGDVVVNLASTGLVANRWLYDGDPEAAAWIDRYVGGWEARARANDGLLPDNVAPDGTVGGLHGGRWYGGHYGWTWPHGLPSVGMAAVVSALNAALVTGDDSRLDTARRVLDAVLDHAVVASVAETPYSLKGGWLARLGADADEPALLVPHRYGRDGWFDYAPMPLELPTWLWWWSRSDADRARLDRVREGLPSGPQPVKAFRDKAEAGHEAPWLDYLDGRLPDYPEQALSMALGQVARRIALIQQDDSDPATVHLHFWQRVNPVVTEVLTQLVSGAPQMLYNGGLPFVAVDYEDADAARPGLPADVAALVTGLGRDRISLELVNVSPLHTRRVVVRPSRFGTSRLAGVRFREEPGVDYPGASTAYAATRGTPVDRQVDTDADGVEIVLPPAHRLQLELITAPSNSPARHRGAAAPDRIEHTKERT